MRILKNILLIIIGLILLFVVVGLFFLPQLQHVERSILISAPPAEVFQNIDSPKSFNQWSPWAKIDPGTNFTYIGPESGTGSGSWTITGTKVNETIKMALDFGNQGQASSSFDLKQEGHGTLITWGFDMDAGMNPMNRWFGLMMDKWVGTDYEKGLVDLKKLVESG